MKKLLRNPFFWAALVGVVAIPLMRPFFRRIPEPPPVLATVPAFELRDQFDRPFGSQSLRGEVYVVSFFFTHCPSICPQLMQSLKKLQARYRQMKVDVRLLSISVDPQNDTPAVLATYAKRYQADHGRWTFLTGPEQQIRELAEKGFLSHVGQPEAVGGGLIDIAHTGKLALVDERGQLRGLYNTDDSGLDELFHRSIHVWSSRATQAQ